MTSVEDSLHPPAAASTHCVDDLIGDTIPALSRMWSKYKKDTVEARRQIVIAPKSGRV
jgi:hypothetical protein